MTSFEWYQYADTGYDLTHAPKNMHLIIETTLYLYYVSTDDETQLWKYTKSTGVDAQLDVDPGDASGDNKSRLRNIQASWIDRANTLIYFADCDNDLVDETFQTWKIDYSDDTVTEISTLNPGAGVLAIYVYDVFLEGVDLYVLLVDRPGTSGVIIYKNGVDPLIDAISFDEPSKVVQVDDNFYFFGGDATRPPEGGILSIFDTDAGTITISGNPLQLAKGTSDANLKGMAYDGVDNLYFTCLDTGDGNKNKLCKYNITTDTTVYLSETDIAIMCDRNNLQTADSPWEFEKAFHLTFSYAYHLSRLKSYLLKLQDLGLTGGETIIAITDKYLITSGKDVYEYTNSIAELSRARATYNIYKTPRAEIHYQTSLSTDQLIEIYENAAGTYTKVFSGRAGIPKYNNRTGKYEFRMINFGNDDLDRPISYEATADGIDEVVIALINDNCKYLYADATSVPNIATNITFNWDTQKLKDILYTIAIVANGYWWFEPNGYFYFRAYSAKPDSGDTYTQATGNIGPPVPNKLQNQFNTWIIFGGIDLSAGRPFDKTETDDAHILHFGESRWKGRDVFPGARTQTDLDAVATALKAWQGMQVNPDNATSIVKGKYYYSVGYYASYQFSYLTEFLTAQDMLISRVQINFKGPGLINVTFSTNIIRRRS